MKSSGTHDTKTQHRTHVMNAIQSILPTNRSLKITAIRTATFLMILTVWISSGQFHAGIFGPVQDENGIWRISKNHELNELIGTADIVRFIKKNRRMA